MSSKEVPETAASSSESDADLSSNSVIMFTVYCLKMYEINFNSEIHVSRPLDVCCFELFWSKGAKFKTCQPDKRGASSHFTCCSPKGKETERLIHVNKTYINLTQPSIGRQFSLQCLDWWVETGRGRVWTALKDFPVLKVSGSFSDIPIDQKWDIH